MERKQADCLILAAIAAALVVGVVVLSNRPSLPRPSGSLHSAPPRPADPTALALKTILDKTAGPEDRLKAVASTAETNLEKLRQRAEARPR
jgi:hypothetical protein